MKRLLILFFALALSGSALGQTPAAPQTVEVVSGRLHLKAFLWKPAGPGPFPAVLYNHGRSNSPQQYNQKFTNTEAAKVLGPVFVKHGYVLLHLFRRGEGLSADQGPFIGDLFQREETTKGEEARRHLQVVLVTTDHLDDALAGLAYLKALPEVDARRIAVVGHSFGAQLTLLCAARDPTIRAAVAFGPAAGSWDRSPELRERLLAAIRKLTAPVMLIHPANDYSVTPGRALADELQRLSKPYVLKMYPAFGETTSDGHNFLYTDVGLWEKDVFEFLNANVGR
jgi:dienelactone hydrolase